MKNLLIKLFSIALTIGLITGCCSTTGLTFVDYKFAKQNGLIVTNYTDNPFFATITYDYSNIENFDVNKVKVELVHDFTPIDFTDSLEFDYLQDMYMSSHAWQMMTIASINNEDIRTLPDREASIISHTPGKIVIFSLDDIGTYHLSYN